MTEAERARHDRAPRAAREGEARPRRDDPVHRRPARRDLRLRLQHLAVQGIPELRRGLHQREQSRPASAATQYIRIFEMEDGEVDLDHADASFQHEVPAEGHFYLGTQCFQCADPPCVKVCPVGATWQEPDGITVIDYDWCIGCRYCMAACPVLGAPLQLGGARGAGGGGEPEPALPRQSRPQDGRRREVHLLHPPHAAGAAARLRRGLPDRRARLRQPARSRSRRSGGCSRTRRSSGSRKT